MYDFILYDFKFTIFITPVQPLAGKVFLDRALILLIQIRWRSAGIIF